MNVVTLVGNLCRDVEVKYTSGENARAMLRNTIAVQRKFKNKETGQYESDFISIQAYGNQAEFIGKYFTKGSKIGITGEIRTGSFTNKDGVKVYTTDVVVNDVEFVTKKDDNGGSVPKADDFVNQGIDTEELNSSLPF